MNIKAQEQSKTKSANCFYCVPDLLYMLNPLGEILPEGTFTVTLDYPLDTKYKFPVKGPKTVEQLAKRVARAYEKIYESKESQDEWGVWGHDIDDLTICGFKVDLVKRKITVDIGS